VRRRPAAEAGVGGSEQRAGRTEVLRRLHDRGEPLMALDTRAPERPKLQPAKVKYTLRDRFQKSFLERNTKLIGLIGVVLIVAFTAVALLLQGGFLTHRYGVHAVFTDAAGVQTGDRVTVAGLDAGRVNGLHIQNGHVVIDLGVNTGVNLTRDSHAVIHIETILGRRSVELVDGSARRPLQNGDYISVQRTETPIDITNLNDISVRLLNRSDAGALQNLMKEVTTITAGKAAQVRTVVTGLERITAAVDQRRLQLGSLLDSLRTVSTTLGSRDHTLVSLIDNLNVVLNNLSRRQQALSTLLQATDSASHQTADLVVRNHRVLDSTLSYLHRDLGILSRHQLDLAATVTYLEKAVEGYSSVGYSAGNVPNTWANIFVQSLGPAGVDALVGKCGAVDQFFDTFFGTNCHKANNFPNIGRGLGGGTGASQQTGAGIGLPPLPKVNLHVDLPLPCTVQDLVRSVLGGPTGCGT
jgi:phospholipid/cholesterol/gamma-HCH transport system substrate-binding protein